MVYFIRRFIKGRKNSGTQDIWTAEYPMTDEDFRQFTTIYGEGKYIICVRGKGIRGFKKLGEHEVESSMDVFNAEETVISVQNDVNISSLSNQQLVGALEQAAENEELKPFMGEIQARLDNLQSHDANDDVLLSAGFPIGGKITTFMVGALSGGVVVYLIYKQKIDTLNEELNSLKDTVHKAEESIKKIEKKTESLANPMTFEQQLMQTYNRTQGYF